MAQRRMFSKEITNSSDFQMMSPSAQALYFHIGMNADDDGFCEVFTIVRMTESKPDDLRSLHERGLVYLVDSKVGIVRDWHINNDIRSDRYTKSKYLSDPKYGDVYKTIMQDKIQSLSRYKDGITDGITIGITQDRLGKDRLGKDINTGFKKPTVSEIKEYCLERQNNIDPDHFFDHYESNGWLIGGKSKMKDWKSAVRTWEKNNFNKVSTKSSGTIDLTNL